MSQFYPDTLPALTSSISQRQPPREEAEMSTPFCPWHWAPLSLHVCAPAPADFQSRAVPEMDRTGVNEMPPPFHPRGLSAGWGSTPYFPLVCSLPPPWIFICLQNLPHTQLKWRLKVQKERASLKKVITTIPACVSPRGLGQVFLKLECAKNGETAPVRDCSTSQRVSGHTVVRGI